MPDMSLILSRVGVVWRVGPFAQARAWCVRLSRCGLNSIYKPPVLRLCRSIRSVYIVLGAYGYASECSVIARIGSVRWDIYGEVGTSCVALKLNYTAHIFDRGYEVGADGRSSRVTIHAW